MAEVGLRTGLVPSEPDQLAVVVAVLVDGAPGERAVGELGAHGYECDDALYLLTSEAWVERVLDGTRLTVDFVVAAETDAVPDPDGSGVVRLLSVSGDVDPVEYGRVADETIVVLGDKGDSLDEAIATLTADGEWQLVFGPRDTSAEAEAEDEAEDDPPA
jgi:hypothetical protein